MQTLLKHWADALLEWLGLASAQDSGWDRWVAFTLVLLGGGALRLRVPHDPRARHAAHRQAHQSHVGRRSVQPDVLSRLCNVVSAVVLGIVLPVVFEEQSEARTIVTRLVEVYIVVAVFRFINAVLFAVFQIASARPACRTSRSRGLGRPGRALRR